MAKNKKAAKARLASKKAMRRQRQFDATHSVEVFETARERKSRREQYWKSLLSEMHDVKVRACAYKWDEVSPFGSVGDLTHYEFRFEHLAIAMKGLPIDMSECHEEGSFPIYDEEDYIDHYYGLFAALNYFVSNPECDTAVSFLDADPDMTDEMLLMELICGKTNEGYPIEIINRAVAGVDQIDEALQFSADVSIPCIEIELSREVLLALKHVNKADATDLWNYLVYSV